MNSGPSIIEVDAAHHGSSPVWDHLLGVRSKHKACRGAGPDEHQNASAQDAVKQHILPAHKSMSELPSCKDQVGKLDCAASP